MHRVIEEIIESNHWREGEFAKFKVNSAGVDEALWCRMSLPMVYAHWEGFVLSSLKLLLSHLNKLEIPASHLTTNLLVLGLGDAYRFLISKQSFGQRVEFTNNFKILLADTVKFNKKINTRSNLNSEVLRDLCAIYNFDIDRFANLLTEIDRLVNIRNSIAHGENSYVLSMENLSRNIVLVTDAMDIFRDEIDKFLTREEYLLQNLRSHLIAALDTTER